MGFALCAPVAFAQAPTVVVIDTSGVSGGNGFGDLIRLIVWMGSIVCGALAAASLLREKVPQVGGALDAIAPFKGIIGVVLAIAALWYWVYYSMIVWFSPLANIVTCLVAIALGVLLGFEFAMAQVAKKSADSAAKMAKLEPQLAKLRLYQVPLGIAGMVCGLIHLIRPQLILF